MANSFLDLCHTRRSVRAYKPQIPETEDLQYIFECVRMAPSAVNFQPWHFFIITNKEKLAALAECYNRDWFKTAPACIVACRNADEEWKRGADGKAHGDIDVAIAVEHLCLAAAERGLGTCWVCNFEVEKCRQALSLADNLHPVVLVPVGYPDDAPREKQRKEMSDFVTIIE